MRIELHGRVQSIQLDPASAGITPFDRLGGRFFSEILQLPAGNYAARVQIMFSEAAAGETIRIGARLCGGGPDLDHLELPAIPGNALRLDHLYLRFRIDEEQTVELYGHAAANCASTLLRFITLLSAEEEEDEESFSFQGYRRPSITDLNWVIFGTPGVCNASCVHCPTNKDYRKHFPHGYMALELFTKIVEDLAEGGFPGWFLFGLFGEPLEDPLFEARLRLIKRLLPSAQISIATNCGVYDPQKHSFVVELADHIGVHVEAISPEIYNHLMHPLKADRVFPKIVSLLNATNRKNVHITTPVHKGNLAEISAIRTYFEAYGAAEPHFTQVGNRSWEGGPWRQMSLLPVGGFCFPDDLKTFVIDWDGAVLGCCLDFSKSAQLGDLTKESVAEVLNGRAWLDMFETHRTKNWCQKEACRHCRTDQYDGVQAMVQPLLAASGKARRFQAGAFQIAPGVVRAEEEIRVDAAAADGIVIYGPYRRLDPGRYRVRHFFEVTAVGRKGSRIELDVAANCTQRLAGATQPIDKLGALSVDLEFDSDGAVTEFRVGKVGAEFIHRGALLQPI
jgi:radical SAM protein with 4Fe4S-binding SPASM domain